MSEINPKNELVVGSNGIFLGIFTDPCPWLIFMASVCR